MKKMKLFNVILAAGLLISVPDLMSQEILHSPFWKNQMEKDILAPWIRFGFYENEGVFHTYLNRSWETFNGSEHYPGMVARHLFSLSAAYLITGRTDYYLRATALYDYLINKGWDQKYGGWYRALDSTGEVVHAEKDLFMQTYAITGLAMYYVITRNRQVLDFIDRSIDVIDKHAWDQENQGGYMKSLNRDLSVRDSGKEFSPQLAPLSGYLTYLYAVTREKKYLEMAEKILDTVWRHMLDPDSGLVLEEFDSSWAPVSGKNDRANTGHNIEVAWMLLRLYRFNGKEAYLEHALKLNEKLVQFAFDGETGCWYHYIMTDNPSIHAAESPWWVQAYGNMFQLMIHRQTRDPASLDNFKKGVSFWNRYFIDPDYGGTYLSVDTAGTAVNSHKAVVTKTSYHAVEHAMLNYIYLDLWINHEKFDLHFMLTGDHPGLLYPLPVEDTDYAIETVRINGIVKDPASYSRGYVSIPSGDNLRVDITIQDR